MSLTFRTASVAVIALLAAATQACWAAEPAATGIDPNTFRPGHPASPRWVIVHSGQEHPAVLVARAAATPAIDPNLFTVQPPASVRWTTASQPAPLLATVVR